MSQRKSGVAILLALAVSGASIALLVQPQTNICNNRPALTVLATAAAFILALTFRLLGMARTGRSLLIAAALLATGSIIADARFVLVHRVECSSGNSE